MKKSLIERVHWIYKCVYVSLRMGASVNLIIHKPVLWVTGQSEMTNPPTRLFFLLEIIYEFLFLKNKYQALKLLHIFVLVINLM